MEESKKEKISVECIMWFLVVILIFIILPILVILTVLDSKKVKEELEIEMNNPRNFIEREMKKEGVENDEKKN